MQFMVNKSSSLRRRSVPLNRLSQFVTTVLLLFAPAFALAQLPTTRLHNIFPAGGKVGTTFEVMLTGAEIEDAHELMFSHPGITAIQKAGTDAPFDKSPHPLVGKFTVTVSANVPVGLHEVRAVGKYGVSNPRMFEIGNLNEVSGKAAGATTAAAKEVPIESSINGQLTAERSDYFRFAAKKGQRVLVECLARRLDSRCEPAMVLTDATGRELARPKERIHRDPLIDFLAPADGSYVVKLYDVLYKGGEEYFYRLSVSTQPFVDFVTPPAGMAGTKTKFSFYGRNLPGGAPTDVKTADGKPLERVEVEVDIPSDPYVQQQLPTSTLVEPSEAFMDAFAYRLATPRGEANPVNIFFATAPVVSEIEPNDTPAQAQKIAPPCEVCGQYNPRGDQDYFTFDAKKGDVYYMEVYSQRLGAPTDPVLQVQLVKHNDKGVEVVTGVAEADDPKPEGRHERLDTYFDALGYDPAIRFVAPEDGTYRVMTRDLYFQSRGNPRFAYRLAIRRESPDFRMVAISEAPINPMNSNQVTLWTPLLHKGETLGVPVMVVRRDSFAGEVQLAVEGLPPGVTCPGATIGPGADVGALVFSAADSIAPWSGMIKVIGKAKIGAADVSREARAATIVWGSPNREQVPFSYRVSSQLALAVTTNEAAVPAVEIGDGKPLETSLAGKLQIPVKVTRRGDFKGVVKLVPAGLPRELRIPELDIQAGQNDGKLNLDVAPNLPPGNYSFTCRVGAEVSYRHNPEAAAAAAESAKAMEKMAAEAAEAARKAVEAKGAADRAVADATTANKQATDASAAAQKALADLQPKLKAATDAKAAAQKASDEATAKVAETTKVKELLDKAPAEMDPVKLKAQTDAKQAAAEQLRIATEKATPAAAQLVTADKAMKDIEAAVSAATTTKAAADKNVVDTAARIKASADARVAADAAANASTEKSKLAEAAKQMFAQKSQQAMANAQPKNVAMLFYSTPVSLKISPAPVTIALAAPPGPVKQGEKLEIPVTIARLFSYNDPVTIAWATPGSDPGVRIAEVQIPAGQTQVKLIVEADQKSAPGDHPLSIRARMQLNGQTVQVDQPLTIKVEPVAPPEKK